MKFKIVTARPKATITLDLYGPCAVTSTLVIIFIAFKSGGPIAYAPLCKHLASHGFHVAVVDRDYSPLSDPAALERIIHFLYTSKTSPFFGRLTDDIALIGHSAGGGDVITSLDRVGHPVPDYIKSRRLGAVVLLAPAFGQNFGFQQVFPYFGNFDILVPAFLGICTADDNDDYAAGRKDGLDPILSGFLIYDAMGLQSPTAHSCPVEKDMVFYIDKTSSTGHYFQNKTVSLAFVTAFLHRHMNNNPYYSDLLKRQIIPASLKSVSSKIQQQHEEREKLTVMDCDHADELLKFAIPSPYGIKLIDNINPWMFDPRYPNYTKCLIVDWDRTTGPAQFNRTFFYLRFTASDVSGYKYLTFRVGQIFPLTPNVGADLDLTVTVNGVSVLLSAYASKIAVPHYFYVDGLEIDYESTKNTLKTCLIPLSAFKNPSVIWDVEFELTINGYRKAVLYFDNVAFWK